MHMFRSKQSAWKWYTLPRFWFEIIYFPTGITNAAIRNFKKIICLI